MQEATDFAANNPYESPIVETVGQVDIRSRPAIIAVVAIIDLLIALFYLAIGSIALGIYFFTSFPIMDEMGATDVAGATLILPSIIANIGMLANRSWAVAVGYTKSALAFIGVAVSIWQVSSLISELLDSEMFYYLGLAAMFIALRIIWQVGYVMCLRKFSRWLQSKRIAELSPIAAI